MPTASKETLEISRHEFILERGNAWRSWMNLFHHRDIVVDIRIFLPSSETAFGELRAER